jgi:hypothetical protein
MLGSLIVHIQHQKTHKKLSLTWAHRIAVGKAFSKALCESDTSPRTTLQSLLDLHEDKDLWSKLSSISRTVLVRLPLKPVESL